jgi:uncharacterized oxidoreductase
MGIHSLFLRYQLSNTAVKVIENAPAAVNSDLGGKGLHTFGAPVDDFADAIFKGLKKGKEEIGYGTSEKSLRMSRDEIDLAAKNIYNRVKYEVKEGENAPHLLRINGNCIT